MLLITSELILSIHVCSRFNQQQGTAEHFGHVRRPLSTSCGQLLLIESPTLYDQDRFACVAFSSSHLSCNR